MTSPAARLSVVRIPRRRVPLGAVLALATLSALPTAAQSADGDPPIADDEAPAPAADQPDHTSSAAPPNAEASDSPRRSSAPEGELPPQGADERRSPLTDAAPKREVRNPLDMGGLTDFMDVWVTFTFSDDNLRRNDSFSPTIDINDRRPESDGRTDITASRLVLYKALGGYLPRIVTEAGLVLRFSLLQDAYGNHSVRLRDDGSYVGLKVRIGADPDDDDWAMDITGFPLDAERFLLGYSYDLTWAGKNSWPQNTGGVPGMRLTLRLARDYYVFAGFKTKAQTNRDELDSQSGASSGSIRTTYAGLFGVGASPEVGGQVRLLLDASGGFIQKGDNPQISEVELRNLGRDTATDDILAYGVSARVGLSWRGGVGDPLDLRLYRQDPRNLFARPFHDDYPGGFSLQLLADLTWMRENLRNFSDTSLATDNFDALGIQVQLRLRYEGFRSYFTYLTRNLEFLLFDGPHGDPPFHTIPTRTTALATREDGSQVIRETARIDKTPEHRLRLSMDYKFREIHFTIGAAFEYQIPATKTLTPVEYDGDTPRLGTKVVTVYKERETSATSTFLTRQVRALLPPGFAKNDIWSVSATFKYDFSDILSAILEISYRQDYNMVKYARDQLGNLVKLEEQSDVTGPIGLGLTLQARF